MTTLSKNYFFGIGGKVVGPLDEKEIGRLIAEGIVNANTLAWCVGQARWEPVGAIEELQQAFGPLLEGQQVGAATASTSPDVPPPLPEDQTVASTPLSHKAKVQANTGHLTPLQSAAYSMVCWLYRPWRGRRSIIREFVDQDPTRAVPVAIGTMVVLGILFVMTIGAMFPPEEPSRSLPSQPTAGANTLGANTVGAMPPGGQLSPNVFLPMIRAQQDINNTIDDVYRYNRDSFDRQCETYRRGTYDWYSSSND